MGITSKMIFYVGILAIATPLLYSAYIFMWYMITYITRVEIPYGRYKAENRKYGIKIGLKLKNQPNELDPKNKIKDAEGIVVKDTESNTVYFWQCCFDDICDGKTTFDSEIQKMNDAYEANKIKTINK